MLIKEELTDHLNKLKDHLNTIKDHLTKGVYSKKVMAIFKNRRID